MKGNKGENEEEEGEEEEEEGEEGESCVFSFPVLCASLLSLAFSLSSCFCLLSTVIRFPPLSFPSSLPPSLPPSRPSFMFAFEKWKISLSLFKRAINYKHFPCRLLLRFLCRLPSFLPRFLCVRYEWIWMENPFLKTKWTK